jgi:hypothetical protein
MRAGVSWFSIMPGSLKGAGLFQHADPNIVSLLHGLPALLNRFISNALNISRLIIEGVVGCLWRRGWFSGRFFRDINVRHVIGRAFDRLGIEIPGTAHIPPPAVPAITCFVMPAALLPGKVTVIHVAAKIARG